MTDSSDGSVFSMPSSDRAGITFGEGVYDGCCERKGLFRGLDVVGYVPGLGSISGVVRVTIAKIAELCFQGLAAIKNPLRKDSESKKAKNASYKFKATYYSREAKRGALEIIPFASIVYDCRVKSHETAQKNDENTLAFGRFYMAGKKTGDDEKTRIDFVFTGGRDAFKNGRPGIEEDE